LMNVIAGPSLVFSRTAALRSLGTALARRLSENGRL